MLIEEPEEEIKELVIEPEYREHDDTFNEITARQVQLSQDKKIAKRKRWFADGGIVFLT